ncbi:MAG TPA: hypothetical protein VMC10_26340 [Stellaceae bacterium]|nr:hypothetical protein [Stellaceae bacterium]
MRRFSCAGPAGEAGPRAIRASFLPAPEWQIEDTWQAIGLRGTGSDHIALRGKWVPTENLVDVMAETPCVEGPLYRAPEVVGFAWRAGGRHCRRAAAPAQRRRAMRRQAGRLAASE